MAETYVVGGPVLIKVGTGSASALETLGYTANGVEITEEPFFDNIPTDLNGGDMGPPGDVQYFGQIDRIRLELTKYDVAIWAKIAPKLKGGTAGTIGTAGSLVFQQSLYFRVLLTGSNFTRNYLACIPRNAFGFNSGTRYTRATMEWECHGLNGTMWNSTTSG